MTRWEEPGLDEEPESPAGAADTLVEAAPSLATVAAELAGLRAEVARDHERAAAREHVIDRLHDENMRLRAGERQLLLRPVLTDLQRLRHELLRVGDQLPERYSGRQAAELLRSYAQNLELTLERGGVEVVSPRPGDAFDPAIHRVTGTVEAAEPGQDATVAEVVLDGYRDIQAGRVVLAAAVRVHRWTPPEQPASTGGEGPGQSTDNPTL
jgi:molecular chaperone GrpE